MRSILEHRESYELVHLPEISGCDINVDDSSQANLVVNNISSVCERMQTASRNIRDAGATAVAWVCNHPLETSILASGAVLACGSLLLGVGLGSRTTACACSRSEFISGTVPDLSSTASLGSTADFASEPTTGFITPSAFESTSVFTSASSTFAAPCPRTLAINCSDLKPFSFNVAQGQGFSLKASALNSLLLHKKPNTLAYDTEFNVDPKAFCANDFFAEKAFSLHCDTDGKDYLLSAKELQAGTTILESGACAVQVGSAVQGDSAVQTDGTIKQFFDCKKLDANQNLECVDNAKKACERVQNFKLTLPPSSKNAGSVFITEKGEVGKDEYRLFFTNHDTASKNLHVDVKTDCEKMLDIPLEFECSGVEQGTRVGFTLRQNLTAVAGQSASFSAGACAYQPSISEEEKSCSIKFGARFECGGVLNASLACQDKTIMLMSATMSDGIISDTINLYVLTPDNSIRLIEYGMSEVHYGDDNDCHVIRRKIKEDYRLRFRIDRHGSKYTESEEVTHKVPADYHTVNLNYDSITFTNDTAIPKGYERPCGIPRVVDKDKDQYSVPLCQSKK